jgi:putative addiction module CopG family antidote
MSAIEVNTMQSMQITVPEALSGYVQSRVAGGGYESAAAYVGELIRADQKQHALAVLGEEILKGDRSGQSVRMTENDWSDIRNEVL